MLSYTLENVFMLTVFQLLISGLILCSSLAILYVGKGFRTFLVLVAAAFSCYSLYFLLGTVFSYQSLSVSVPSVIPLKWELLIPMLERAALVFLALAFTLETLHKKLRNRLWIPAVVAFAFLSGIAYLAGRYFSTIDSRFSLSALINGVWLAGIGGFIFERYGREGLRLGSALFLLAVAQFLRAPWQGAAPPNSLWTTQNAALLVGLGLLALVVESRSDHFPIRFFLRLNLIFIAVASMLILMVAEIERREYLAMTEKNAGDLSEYLRGEVIYLSNQGMAPAEILSSPEILGRVTSDFGRLADLRRVRISFQGWMTELAIADDGLVTHEIYSDLRSARSRSALEDRARIATLTRLPISLNGTVTGSVELDESLSVINSRVARHMRIIFLAFTLAVFVAAGLFAFTVQYVHKTIQRQLQELKNTNAQLIHVERLASVGRLAGGFAHEINNPAGIMVTTSDHLLRESEKEKFPERFREDLRVIRRQAWRVSEIVNGLLTFSRPTVLHKQSLDINAVLQGSLQLVAPRFREQKVQIVRKLAPDLPLTSGDSDRLEQVFVNVLNNAADAMPHGGEIMVESKMTQVDCKPYVEVSVADSGIGITKEDLRKIFDPFFSTKPKGKGTGLGLSISHGIIRDHEGRIEVDSELGRGTVVRVFLPAGGAHEEL